MSTPSPASTFASALAVDDEPWRRLSVRVVHLDLIRVAVSLITGYLGSTVADDPVWPLIAGAGLVGAFLDLKRWQTTRYRITPQRVEMRSGWLARKHRIVARDRIRSVDSSARLLPRLFGLRTVHIGSGESESSFTLDGLDRRHAARLHQELMPGQAAARRVHGKGDARLDAKTDTAGDIDGEAAGDAGPSTAAPGAEVRDPETVIARLRREWVPLNVVTVWSVLAVAGPLFGLHWFLRPFGVDLYGFARGLLDWDSYGPAWTIVLILLVAYPIGIAGTTIAFLLENGNFELVRKGTPPHTALVTRRGLLTTRTVQRTDERLRGIAFEEPLAWRWLHLATTEVISTGLRQTGESTTGGILPRIRLPEARDLAARILPDGSRPLETALHRHPRGALVRRLGWAAYGPALASGVLLLFGRTGALPEWVWPLPLVLIPLTVPAAVVAYRSLGHGLSAAYLIVRGGVLSRSTVALQRRAVIGWTFEQSILQRRGGRITVGVATAAGDRHYTAPDASVQQALAFAAEATPDLARHFIEADDDAQT